MKKKLIVVILILLLITSFAILRTYALFETVGSASSNLSIGKWQIKINDVDVSLSENISLNNFVYNNSIHTQSGYFAPGDEAYFDIEIDCSQTQVSVLYSIDIDDSSLSGHPNIYFSIEDLSTREAVSDFPMEGLVVLSNSNKIIRLRIHLVWDNILTYDENDTELIDGDLRFALTANFLQYLGE